MLDEFCNGRLRELSRIGQPPMRKINSFYRSMKNCFQGKSILFALAYVCVCSERHHTIGLRTCYTHFVTKLNYSVSLLWTLFHQQTRAWLSWEEGTTCAFAHQKSKVKPSQHTTPSLHGLTWKFYLLLGTCTAAGELCSLGFRRKPCWQYSVYTQAPSSAQPGQKKHVRVPRLFLSP